MKFILLEEAKTCDKRRLSKIECSTKYEQKRENLLLSKLQVTFYVFLDKVFLFMFQSKQIGYCSKILYPTKAKNKHFDE